MDEATRAQIYAAHPMRNVWVSANAGSGKTRVLIDRVVRLMLAGSPPDHILCLTYTKAAAAEMLQRLYERLGNWAMLGDADLRAALDELGEDGANLSSRRLSYARQLFAQALDTPGGLKVQTIHSFCESILRRFPIEAAINPNFQLLDERQEEEMIAQVLNQTASADNEGFKAFAQLFPSEDLIVIAKGLLPHEMLLKRRLAPCDFELDETLNKTTLRAQVLDGHAGLLEGLARIFERGGANDQKIAPSLRGALGDNGLEELEKKLLHGAQSQKAAPFSAKLNTLPSKVTQRVLNLDAAAFSEIRAQIDTLALRVETARVQRLALRDYENAQTLHRFAAVFFKIYYQYKERQSALSYDDLIARTNALLRESSMAAWVLFRLDSGLDHILVDEAQDTSSPQWQIIESLSEAIAHNRAPDDRAKSLFVVGDEKQSIYSFQGANPDVFYAKRDDLNQRFTPAKAPIESAELQYSFRSSAVILDLVDKTFATQLGANKHRAFHKQKAGRVELWPFLEKEKDQDETPWYVPINAPSAQDSMRKLAQQIATRIKTMLRNKISVDGKTAIRAGDILILVQKRSAQFKEILRALKTHNLPIAGADRVTLQAHLAVRDVISCLRFAALPDDDLSLAEALRSPIFGLSEADLFTLAHGRTGTLWQSLRQNDDFAQCYTQLKRIRSRVDFDRPFELIEYILTRLNARENLIARIGEETADALDELLAEALRFEQNNPPTLSSFLAWFDLDDVTIKRELQRNLDRIRVMTVHGAKGLEAPLVILADTGRQRGNPRSEPKFYADEKTIFLAKSNSDAAPALLALKDRARADRNREKQRLLYVAMTRAQSQLIICGAGERTKEGNDWYDLVAPHFTDADDYNDADIGTIKRISVGDWDKPPAMAQEIKTDQMDCPDWLCEPISPLIKATVPIITPSQLDGDKSFAGEVAAPENATLIGTAIHLLLQNLPHLPVDQQSQAAIAMMTPFALQDTIKTQTIQRALQIINTPDLAWLFDADGLPEASFNTPYKGHIIKGTVDRLIVTDQRVMVVDFKSNQTCPSDESEIPSGLLVQLGAYGVAMGQIYPQHQIALGILWTQTASFMPVSKKYAIEAFNTTLPLDPRENHF